MTVENLAGQIGKGLGERLARIDHANGLGIKDAIAAFKEGYGAKPGQSVGDILQEATHTELAGTDASRSASERLLTEQVLTTDIYVTEEDLPYLLVAGGAGSAAGAIALHGASRRSTESSISPADKKELGITRRAFLKLTAVLGAATAVLGAAPSLLHLPTVWRETTGTNPSTNPTVAPSVVPAVEITSKAYVDQLLARRDVLKWMTAGRAPRGSDKGPIVFGVLDLSRNILEISFTESLGSPLMMQNKDGHINLPVLAGQLSEKMGIPRIAVSTAVWGAGENDRGVVILDENRAPLYMINTGQRTDLELGAVIPFVGRQIDVLGPVFVYDKKGFVREEIISGGNFHAEIDPVQIAWAEAHNQSADGFFGLKEIRKKYEATPTATATATKTATLVPPTRTPTRLPNRTLPPPTKTKAPTPKATTPAEIQQQFDIDNIFSGMATSATSHDWRKENWNNNEADRGLAEGKFTKAEVKGNILVVSIDTGGGVEDFRLQIDGNNPVLFKAPVQDRGKVDRNGNSLQAGGQTRETASVQEAKAIIDKYWKDGSFIGLVKYPKNVPSGFLNQNILFYIK